MLSLLIHSRRVILSQISHNLSVISLLLTKFHRLAWLYLVRTLREINEKATLALEKFLRRSQREHSSLTNVTRGAIGACGGKIRRINLSIKLADHCKAKRILPVLSPTTSRQRY